MSSGLLMNSLNEDSYLDYIENILNIFRLSSKSSYILLNAKVSNNNCVLNLSIINEKGESQKFSDMTFKCDENFYSEFLDVLVSKIYNDCDIVRFDSVNLDNDEFYAFRMITENNDLLTIDGLSDYYVKHLKEICEKNDLTDEKSYSKLLNNIGFSNFGMIALIVLVIILILLVLYFILTI